MNNLKLKFILVNEIKNLNRMIDLKITRGLSYRNEAQRHKRLLRQLDSMSRSRQERSFAFF